MKMPFNLMQNYVLPKRRDEAWTIPSRVYWDNVGKCCTVDDGGARQVGVMTITVNALIGIAAESADHGSETGIVRLNGTEFD
jgi:predicted RecA/RadA family phage recombinase